MDQTKGDFCELVTGDCQLIKLQLSEDAIRDLSRYQLKLVVKKRAREATIQYLSEIKETKSKVDGITYSGPFTLQAYMQSDMIDEKITSLLLALQTRTVRGIRSDFGEMFPNKSCPLEGCSLPDSLGHILTCTLLTGTARSSTVQYSHGFSGDLQVQWEATSYYSQLL